jgi:hypothetical protein
VHFAGEKTSNVVSDNTWLSSNRDTPHWETLAFNDAAWSKAASVARYGDAPWGRLEQRSNEMSGPQSAGMSNGVRIIYVPENEAAIVRNLTADRAYSATYFDPVSGARSAAPPVTIDATGSWGCPAPSGNDHDWVLILEPQSKVPAARAAR